MFIPAKSPSPPFPMTWSWTDGTKWDLGGTPTTSWTMHFFRPLLINKCLFTETDSNSELWKPYQQGRHRRSCHHLAFLASTQLALFWQGFFWAGIKLFTESTRRHSSQLQEKMLPKTQTYSIYYLSPLKCVVSCETQSLNILLSIFIIILNTEYFYHITYNTWSD